MAKGTLLNLSAIDTITESWVYARNERLLWSLMVTSVTISANAGRKASLWDMACSCLLNLLLNSICTL